MRVAESKCLQRTSKGVRAARQSISVAVNGDLLVEPDQNFAVDLSGIQASGRDVVFGDQQGLAAILNDDFFAGRVFDDRDNDGVFEIADEDTGIAGVLMRLINETTGDVVDSANTSEDGRYEFDVTLEAGTYKIVEVVDELVELSLLDGSESAGSTAESLTTRSTAIRFPASRSAGAARHTLLRWIICSRRFVRQMHLELCGETSMMTPKSTSARR